MVQCMYVCENWGHVYFLFLTVQQDDFFPTLDQVALLQQ
jgi:hypothetical protein